MTENNKDNRKQPIENRPHGSRHPNGKHPGRGEELRQLLEKYDRRISQLERSDRDRVHRFASHSEHPRNTLSHHPVSKRTATTSPAKPASKTNPEPPGSRTPVPGSVEPGLPKSKPKICYIKFPILMECIRHWFAVLPLMSKSSSTELTRWSSYAPAP